MQRNCSQYLKFIMLLCFIMSFQFSSAQLIDVVLGQGNHQGIQIQSSSETTQGQAENTFNEIGFLPNYNAASRFLSQSSFGHSFEDIEYVSEIGIDDWMDQQISMPVPFSLLDKVIEYHDFRRIGLSNPEVGSSVRFWDYAWWQYHMSSNDDLRQRVAFALSEILVISVNSGFSNEPYAFSSFYDIFLEHSFGNYRDILQEVTYHPAMGVYLTYINNPKSDPSEGTFPDENYARELMQLFTIGLYELNNDGSRKVDSNGAFIPTYDNIDIAEFSKIFTGLSWWDRDQYFKNYMGDSSWMNPMIMFEEYHEPGVKNLLNGFQVQDRNPVDGNADISDALDNIFNHPNVGPFLSKILIQRLITSNPTPSYIERVSTKFNDNGQGVRGDMSAVIKAILLDDEARSCSNLDNVNYGKLREPFIRYVQMNKAFDANTLNGNYRNDMDYVYRLVGQKPLKAPSVFNFFQNDHQPIGPIEQADLVAPEFQITNSQTITEFVNGLYRWIVLENIADEYGLYSGEDYNDFLNEITTIDISDEQMYADDIHLHIMVDRLNLILAQGNLSENSVQTIINALKEFDQDDADDLEFRTKLAIYLVMSSPEYLIHR